jgi:hypothetical protein
LPAGVSYFIGCTSSVFIQDFGFIPGAENAGAVFSTYGVPLYLPADCLLLPRNL